MKVRGILAFTTAVLLSAGSAAAQNWDEPEGTTEDTTTAPKADEAKKAPKPGPGGEAKEADEPKPISLGLLLGYGIYLGEGDFNPFSLGLGLKGGYALDMGLYLGGKFIYFLGESVDVVGFESSGNVMTAGFELGYNIDVDPVIIQPSVEVGLAIWFFSMEQQLIPTLPVEEVSDSEIRLYVAPGASVIYPLNGFFVGGDLRVPLIFADSTEAALTIMANAGLAF